MWLLVLCFLVLLDPFLELKYRAKLWWNRSAQPFILANRPLGFSESIRAYRAQKSGKIHRYLEQYFAKRKTFVLQVVGDYALYTIDPEVLQAVLVTQFKEFSIGHRSHAVYPLIGEGLLGRDGEQWRHTRNMMRPLFNMDIIQDLTGLRYHADKLVEFFRFFAENPSASGEVDGMFDAQEAFFKFTMDRSTDFFFGESSNFLQSSLDKLKGTTREGQDSFQKFADSFQRAQDFVFFRIIAQSLWRLITSKRFREDVCRCKQFVDTHVATGLRKYTERKSGKAMDGDKNGKTFLEALIHETSDSSNDKRPGSHGIMIRDQALGLFLASRDTTAGTLSWALYLMARHPEVYSRLREEILQQFGTDPDNITVEKIKHCEYLRCVIHEVMRLQPVAPANFRHTRCNTTLPRGGGPDGKSPLFMPQGMRVFFSVYCLHRCKEFWGEHAEDFRPKRWQNGFQPANGTYMPFSRGPRICIGQNLALNTINYTLVRIVQAFPMIETSPMRHEVKPLEHLNLSMKARQGVFVNFCLNDT